jgi:hypothetical protein
MPIKANINKGDKYGLLTIIKEVASYISPSGKLKVRKFLCKCKCGKTKEITLTSLNLGTSSCGHLQIEAIKQSNKLRSNKSKRYHPLFNTYQGMLARCYNINNERYTDYGGRGIKVCKNWRNKNGINNFIIWGEPKYQKGLELDRKNNDKGYSPNNCRFVTSKINSRNRRDNIIVIYKGKSHKLVKLAEKYAPQLSYSTIYTRIRQGWTVEEAINNKLRINQYG